MNGKGDRSRVQNRYAYRTNCDLVFGQCSKHPNYTPGNRCPRCSVCKRIWREQQPKTAGAAEKK